MRKLINRTAGQICGAFILVLAVVLSSVSLTACKQKKKSDDIVVRKAAKPKPQPPVRMQEYKQLRDFKWLNRDYQVDIRRMADDSLRMVKDETGQLFVDNSISLKIFRSDGSLFFSKVFTKSAFESQLNDDYRRTGILEGIVFDRVEGTQLYLAGSVCHPQTDEYIPFIISISSLGDVDIRPDDDLDTNGSDAVEVNL